MPSFDRRIEGDDSSSRTNPMNRFGLFPQPVGVVVGTILGDTLCPDSPQGSVFALDRWKQRSC